MQISEFSLPPESNRGQSPFNGGNALSRYFSKQNIEGIENRPNSTRSGTFALNLQDFYRKLSDFTPDKQDDHFF
jgi:hypothetical protein